MTNQNNTDVVTQIMGYLPNHKGDEFKFCKEKIDVFGPWLQGDKRFSDLFREILRLNKYLSYELFKKAEKLLALANQHYMAGINRFEYLHVVVCVLHILPGFLKSVQGTITCLNGDFDAIQKRFMDLLIMSKEATEYNKKSHLPIFSCLISSLSHYLRHGVKADLRVGDYVCTLTKLLITKEKHMLSTYHPKEPTKYVQSAYFAEIGGKSQPANRKWQLLTKKVRNGVEICSIHFKK